MPYNTTAIPPRTEPTGQTQLPLSRVKKIINQDADVHMCSNNAAFVITLAAEMFIQHLADEANTQAKLERKPRRNIQYKDIANAVSHHDNLEFLEDTVPKTTPLKKIRATAQATQSRLRGEKPTPLLPQSKPLAGGGAATNGASHHRASHHRANGERTRPAAFSVRPVADEGGDPNDQLELETRQARGGGLGGDGDGDVHMVG